MDNTLSTSQSAPDAFGNVYEQVYQFIEELGTNNLEALIDKYGEETFLTMVFDNNYAQFPTVDTLVELSHSFLLKFWPAGQPVNLDKIKRKELIDIFARLPKNADPSIVQASITQINPYLMIPVENNIDELRIKAIKLYNAYDNIAELISREHAEEYVADALNFYKMSPEKLIRIHQGIKSISDDLVLEYQKLNGETFFEPGRELLAKISDLYKEIGRTPLYISSEEEKQNLGELAEMFLKLNTSVQAAIEMQKNPKQAETELGLALFNIKKVLKPGIQL